MARIARIKTDFGIFHIRQSCGGNRRIFECESDKERFLSILRTTQIKYQYQLYGYCLTRNEYHLLIKVNGTDLSKVMKSINIAYAMYIKCDGQLFKDRFKSEMIDPQKDLKLLMQDIESLHHHEESWNYCVFDAKKPLEIPLILSHKNECSQTCIHTLEEAKTKLLTEAAAHHVSVSDFKTNKVLRNAFIKELRSHSTLSLKSIGSLVDLTESTVSKLLNQTLSGGSHENN